MFREANRRYLTKKTKKKINLNRLTNHNIFHIFADIYSSQYRVFEYGYGGPYA